MNEKKSCVSRRLSLASNVAIVGMVTYATWLYCKNGIPEGFFKYFTNLSNYLCALSALVLLPFNIRSLKQGRDAIPRWALAFKYVGTCAVTVTLVTVLVFLGPTMGYLPLFVGGGLFLHGLVPLVALLSLLLLERDHRLGRQHLLLGVFPTLAYSLYYTVRVFVPEFCLENDFYGFTLGGKIWAAPISLLGMYAMSLGIALGVRALHDRHLPPSTTYPHPLPWTD